MPGILTDDVPQKLCPGGRDLRADVHRHQMLFWGWEERRIASDYVEYRPPPSMHGSHYAVIVKEGSTETKDCLAMARQKYLTYKRTYYI